MIHIPDIAQSTAAVAVDAVTDADKIKMQWFEPWHLIMYCFILFVLMVVYYQWRWAKTVRMNVLALLVRSDGSTYSVLVSKREGSVNLKDQATGVTKTWPINKMSTIDVLYPGVGFIPAFLQKQIRMVILDEEDWEPMINRDPDKKLIASPAVLGNLLHERVTEMVMTVSKDTMDKLTGLIAKMEKFVDRQTFYIGIGIIAILCIVSMVLSISNKPDTGGIDELQQDMLQVKQALGLDVIPHQSTEAVP